MAEQPRAKGQFVQCGTWVPVVAISGTPVSVDGVLAKDTVVLQADYPVLFEVIGTDFNDAGKGDDPATQMRTPPTGPLADTDDCVWMIRY